VTKGSLEVEEGRVTGHEYGLLSHEAEVAVRGFTSTGAERAGLGLVKSRGTLEDVTARESGTFGGMQFVSSDLTLRRFRVEGAREYGLTATQGRLRASEGTVTRVRSTGEDAGDGLHLREVRAEVADVVVREAPGACVLAAQAAEVTLSGLSLSGCRHSGVTVETFAQVTAVGLEVRGPGGPAVAVLRDGVLRLDGLTGRELPGGLLWAECQGEARVLLGRVTPREALGPLGRCVGPWAREDAGPGR
jgi:hypothetical protein